MASKRPSPAPRSPPRLTAHGVQWWVDGGAGCQDACYAFREPRNPKARRWGKAVHSVTTGEPLRRCFLRPRSRQKHVAYPYRSGFPRLSRRSFNFLAFRIQHSAVQPSFPRGAFRQRRSAYSRFLRHRLKNLLRGYRKSLTADTGYIIVPT